MSGTAFHIHRGKAAALALVMAVLAGASAYVIFLNEATWAERWSAVASTILFAWGLAQALARVFEGDPVLVIDEGGICDRRMKIDAPWSSIRGVRVWVQQADIAQAAWIALDVENVAAVRALHPLWAQIRRATLERWGRPPVALNLQGLEASPENVLSAIARFRPDLTAPVNR